MCDTKSDNGLLKVPSRFLATRLCCEQTCSVFRLCSSLAPYLAVARVATLPTGLGLCGVAMAYDRNILTFQATTILVQGILFIQSNFLHMSWANMVSIIPK